METLPLFYEDIFDALNKTTNGNPQGLVLKQIASDLWPSRNPDTARSLLSRALNPENTDARLSPDEVVRLMDVCGPEHVLFFLCDRFGFDRPVKKNRSKFEKEVKDIMKGLTEQMQHVARQIKALEGMRE